MHINKNKKIKPISRDGLMYALAFVLYAAILILVFIYATKFLSNTLNIALSTPAQSEIEAKYGQLDLESYILVADKLELKKPAVSSPEITQPEITSQEISPITEIATSSDLEALYVSDLDAPDVVIPIITPEIVTPIITPVTVELRPRLVINNSTNKTGIASQLKNKFTAAGYSVLRIGNVKPVVNKTIIKVKASLNPNSSYLQEIKKIVALDYDFVLENLTETADHEVEIIIGNK